MGGVLSLCMMERRSGSVNILGAPGVRHGCLQSRGGMKWRRSLVGRDAFQVLLFLIEVLLMVMLVSLNIKKRVIKNNFFF